MIVSREKDPEAITVARWHSTAKDHPLLTFFGSPAIMYTIGKQHTRAPLVALLKPAASTAWQPRYTNQAAGVPWQRRQSVRSNHHPGMAGDCLSLESGIL
jgi:hypothetical protein